MRLTEKANLRLTRMASHYTALARYERQNPNNRTIQAGSNQNCRG